MFWRQEEQSMLKNQMNYSPQQEKVVVGLLASLFLVVNTGLMLGSGEGDLKRHFVQPQICRERTSWIEITAKYITDFIL